MNKLRLTLGIIATAISSVILLFCIILITANVFTSTTMSYALFSLIVLILGIIAIATSGNSVDRQAFEEYKRMKQQEQDMYYRYANAQGKPIEEYTIVFSTSFHRRQTVYSIITIIKQIIFKSCRSSSLAHFIHPLWI